MSSSIALPPVIVSNAFAAVGASTLAYLAFKTLSALRFQFHSSKLHRYRHGPEPWALVTGASDGIGLAFVNELATRGFNVILHGRNEAKLRKHLADLEPKYKTKFKLLVLDSGTPATPSFDEAVLSVVKGLNLTVVIHNVAGNGQSQIEMPNFDKMSASQVDGWIGVNARFPTQLTRVLLPILLKNQPGLMIFVSSAVTEMTAPGVSLYTATKAYVEAFTKCLRLELKMDGRDIELKSLTTGMVATASSGRHEKDISFTMPSTRDFVKSALGKVGWGSPRITPWLGHRVQLGFMTSLPMWVQEMMIISLIRKTQEAMAKKN